MGGMVDLLAAKVPDIEMKFSRVCALGLVFFTAGEGVDFNADALGSVVHVGQRAVRLRDFMGQGSFACFAFTDDEHFGLVEVVLTLGGQLVIVIKDISIALTNYFYRGFFNRITQKNNFITSEWIIDIDCHSLCRQPLRQFFYLVVS